MTKIFTTAELQNYNGQNGQPAYVAINGTVYDVSNISAWANGTHHGNQAGKDLTEPLFKYSPHKDKVLAKLPVVGKLSE